MSLPLAAAGRLPHGAATRLTSITIQLPGSSRNAQGSEEHERSCHGGNDAKDARRVCEEVPFSLVFFLDVMY